MGSNMFSESHAFALLEEIRAEEDDHAEQLAFPDMERDAIYHRELIILLRQLHHRNDVHDINPEWPGYQS